MPSLPSRFASFFCAASVLLAAHAASAQTAPKIEPAQPLVADKAIEMSPFLVSTDSNRGYAASTILQGGRGRVELQDVATQVAVFTKDFMQDIAATNIEEAYLFSSNTQTYYEMVSSDAGHLAGAQQTAVNNSSRGLGGLNKTRDFSNSRVEADTYNTERLAIVSGANAVQFGLGGAAGTSDTVSARALPRSHYKVQARFDSYGSERFVLDLNQVLKKDVLSLRAIWLKDNKEYFLRPGYDDNERSFLAGTWRPFRSTTIRADVERIKRVVSRGSTIFPRNAGYLEYYRSRLAGSPIAYNNLPSTAGTAGRPAAPTMVGADGVSRSFAFNTAEYLFTYGNVPANMVGAFDYRNTVTPPVVGTALTESFYLPQLYPWNANPMGFGRINDGKSEVRRISIEQRLGPNTYVEVSGKRESFKDEYSSLFVARAYDIMVDVNRFRPDGATANPLYGRAFVEESGSGGFWESNSIEDARATLSHLVDFTKKSGWAHHLGRHQLGGFASFEEEHQRALSLRPMIIGNPSFLPAAARNDPLHASRQFTLRYYLPEIGGPTSPSISDHPEAYGVASLNQFGPLTGIQSFRHSNGEDFQVTTQRNPAGYVSPVLGAYNHLQRRSYAASSLSSFLGNRLVVNVGARRDSLRNSNNQPRLPLITQSGNLRLRPYYGDLELSPDWSPTRSATRLNYGFVARPLFEGKWMAFTFEHSKNATLDDVRVIRDLAGGPLEASYGESKEIGVRLFTPDGKLNAKLAVFDSFARNEGLANFGLINNLLNFERQLFSNRPSYPIHPQFDPALGLVSGDFRIPAHRKSSGFDFELVYNPNQNFRLMVNSGRSKSVIESAGSSQWFDYIDQKLTSWRGFGGNWATAIYTGNETVEAAYNRLVDNPRDDTANGLGMTGANSPSWRANFVANYTFTSGRLRGGSIGANGRYRGASIIGFGEYRDEKGRPFADRSIVWRSETYTLFGATGGYRFKLFNANWRGQLNVNNLFDDAKVVISRAFPDGRPRNYGRQPGREYILSFDVEY